MKYTGKYDPIENDFDIDAEINGFCAIIENRISPDLKHYDKKDKEAIKKALIETIKEI